MQCEGSAEFLHAGKSEWQVFPTTKILENIEVRYLFKSRKRLGDALLCMPGALHLSRQGHDVWIDCPELWHPIFKLVSYVRPWTTECGMPDKIFDTNELEMPKCSGQINDYINEAFPELRDIPRGTKVVFDLLPKERVKGLPDRYILVSPFGYSQFATPNIKWFVPRIEHLLGSLDKVFWLTDRERLGCPSPLITAKTVSDLPAIIRDAEEVVTINSSPNIIASAVRLSHFMIWDRDPINGRTNYIVPHQVVLKNKDEQAFKNRNVFDSWYEPGGQGSGPGSSESYTKEWRFFLEEFIRNNGIKTILDYGCGDWGFSQHIDWADRMYYGVDIVPSLITQLRKKFGTPRNIFYTVDPLDPELPNEIDLVISKDVLQHLSNADIIRTLDHFKRAKYWLLVNDRLPETNNEDIRTGGYRCLDLRKPPFNLEVQDVFRFPPQPHTPEIPKIAVLIKNRVF